MNIMCGIFGIMSTNDKPLSKQARLKFLTMGLDTMIRGTDASGVFNNALRFAKQAGPFCFLTATRGYRRVVNDPSAKYLVGHCRQATQGSPDDNKNNHPLFGDDKNCLVVHNGIISKSDPSRVDSYEIVKGLELVNENDLYLKVKKVKVEGSGTFVAGNREKLTFHVFQHATGSGLYFAAIKGLDAVAFASTYGIIGVKYTDAEELLETFVFECEIGKATVPHCVKKFAYPSISHYGRPNANTKLTKRERKRLRKFKRLSEEFLEVTIDKAIQDEVDNAIVANCPDGSDKPISLPPSSNLAGNNRINLDYSKEDQDEVSQDEEDDAKPDETNMALDKGEKSNFYIIEKDGEKIKVLFPPSENKVNNLLAARKAVNGDTYFS